MTKLVERILINIELDADERVYGGPRDQLKKLWMSLSHMLEAKGKWHINSDDGLDIWLTNLGLEEVPEETGSDN